MIPGNWRRDFGDNDLLGWATTLAYFAVAALCFRAARALRRHAPPDGPRERAPPDQESQSARDWVLIGAGLILLGLNKQLDLQILARDAGVALVKLAGFDAQRRWVGRVFVVLVSVAVLWVLGRAARRLRGARRGHTLTLVGLAMLACFFIARAAQYLPFLKDVNVRFNDVLHIVLELGGLAVVGASAWRGTSRAPAGPQGRDLSRP